MQSTKICSFDGCDKPHYGRGLCQGHCIQHRKGQELRPLKPSSRGLTLEQRFWAKVRKTDDCWLWTASTTSQGYGQIKADGWMRYAHRVSWELTNDPIPDGMDIDHRCANRKCVNPEHLRVTTRSQNMQHLTGPRKDNTSGVRGVSWEKRQGAWRVQVQTNGRDDWGGYHSTLEAADKAARALRAQLHTHDDHEEWVSKHKENKTVAAVDLVAVRSVDGVVVGYEKL